MRVFDRSSNIAPGLKVHDVVVDSRLCVEWFVFFGLVVLVPKLKSSRVA